MIKALCKKSRDNKGFSLIELIVVIAIIAILALILVPRFGGFTKDAKEAADNATAKTIETAVIALITNGKLTYTSYNPDTGESLAGGTIQITNPPATGGDSTITPSGGVTLTISDLTDMIGSVIKSETGDGFEVTISSDGNVTCAPYTN
jgi:prepilin-type N-terminal cleavage/methylation domain-containing protein